MPDEDNAAVLLQGIMPDIDRCHETERKDPKTKLLWIDSRDAACSDRSGHKRMVDIYADALQVAHRALARPKCRFDVDWTQGLSADTSHHRRLRSLARALASEAIVHAHAERGAEAAKSIGLILRTTAIMDEPILVSQLTALAFVTIALETTARACSLDCLGDADLRAITAKLAGLDPLSAVKRGLSGDRAQAIAVYDSLAELARTGDGKTPHPLLGTRSLEFVSDCWIAGDEGWYLGVLRRLETAMDLAPTESLLAMEAILREATEEVESSPRRYAVSALLMPAFGLIRKVSIDHAARRDSARVGLACERFRLVNGRYPEELNALVPNYLEELPLDPYTERPLMFRVEDEGRTCRVYSVGRNLSDDGGVYVGAPKAPDDPGWLVKRQQANGRKKETK